MIRLCPATPADAPACFTLWQRAVAATHDFLLPADAAAIAAQVQGDLGMLAQAVSTLRAAVALLTDAGRADEARGARAALAEVLIMLAGADADPEAAREGFGLLDALLLETATHGPAPLQAHLAELRTASAALRRLCGL